MADNHTTDSHDGYVHGSQDISEQAATFSAFIGMAKWGSLWIAALVAFLTIWFMPGGSFVGGGFAFVVMLVAGWWFLKKPAASH